MIKSIATPIKSFFLLGDQRTLLAKKNIALSFFIKGGSIIANLILVPLTINYVNPADFGIWLTISALISWIQFLDIGLGNGLKNKLVEANAKGDTLLGRHYVSTTYAVLVIISALLFTIFFCINPYVNWGTVFNAPGYTGNALNKTVLILFAFISIQFVVQNINVILLANHALAKSSFILLICQLASIIVIYLLSKTTSGSLNLLVLSLGGIPCVVYTLSSIFLYKTAYRNITPAFRFVKLKYVKSLLGVGGIFLFIQIGVVILYQTDNIVIAQLFGPVEVTTFNIVYKLFSLPIIISTIIITPFWSAFTEAFVKKDFDWINRSFSQLYKMFFTIAASTILLLLLSPLFYRMWIGSTLTISFNLSLTMAIYVVVYVWHAIHVAFLNGIGKLRFQLVLVVISSLVNIPLSFLLGPKFGLPGVIISNTIVFLFMGIFVSIQSKKILNNTAKGIWNK